MTTIAATIARLSTMASTMTQGDALRRTHYTQAMGGSQWRTLTAHMMEAQGGKCALTGQDMRRARADAPDALTLHLLVPSVYWGTDADRAATTANNGKALDPYRFGFVPGNVVLALTAASRMVRSELATPALLAMDDAAHLSFWTSDMTRAAKVKAPERRDDIRRDLMARGWVANG